MGDADASDEGAEGLIAMRGQVAGIASSLRAEISMESRNHDGPERLVEQDHGEEGRGEARTGKCEVLRGTRPPDLFCSRKKQEGKDPDSGEHCEVRLFSAPRGQGGQTILK